jgi:hypothetical protein
LSNRLYPNWEQLNSLNNPLTEGEKSLIHYLDNNLPQDPSWTKDKKLTDYKGWLIFAQPFLNGSRPDVIIYNPFVGVVIYEVKDWKLENYEWDKDYEGRTSLFVHDSRGRYPIKNPIYQVEHYKDKIIGQLVPNIGEAIDKEKKNFGLIKTALYFHKIRTHQAQEFFGTKIKDFRYFPVFGFDDLQPNKLNSIVPDVHISKSKFWDTKWNEELLFWFKPPYHSIEQGVLLTLKPNQLKIAEPTPGHHRVRGVAGSGKTQALAYRAGKLASQKKNVLIVSFNITLWHYIKDMIARSPFNFTWDSFTFTHFHGFCKDKLNEFGAKFPHSPQPNEFSITEEYEAALEYFFKVTVPNAVLEVIKDKHFDKYDAILIDEGQDYNYEWYKFLFENFLTSRDELLVVTDKRQNIYDRELDWLDMRLNKELRNKFSGDFIRLTETFRLPKKVAMMSNDFSQEFNLDQEVSVDKIKEMPALIHSQHIIWLNIQQEEWLKYILSSFNRLKQESYNPSDMVVLLPSHKYGKECVNFFKEKNIEVNHVFEDDSEVKYHPHKKSFWMGDGRLKMSTIHSFKGWELANIVLFIPKKAPESNKRLDAIVYTAITRTRENLIVLNSNKRYDSFGDKFPKKWDEQN